MLIYRKVRVARQVRALACNLITAAELKQLRLVKTPECCRVGANVKSFPVCLRAIDQLIQTSRGGGVGGLSISHNGWVGW